MQAAQVRPAYAGGAQLRKERRRDKLRSGPTHRLWSAFAIHQLCLQKLRDCLRQEGACRLGQVCAERGRAVEAACWPIAVGHTPFRETGTTSPPPSPPSPQTRAWQAQSRRLHTFFTHSYFLHTTRELSSTETLTRWTRLHRLLKRPDPHNRSANLAVFGKLPTPVPGFALAARSTTPKRQLATDRAFVGGVRWRSSA